MQTEKTSKPNRAKIAYMILIVMALICFASFAHAENMDIKYYSATTGALLANTSVSGNVTLPNATMNIKIYSSDSKFRITANSVYPQLELNTSSRDFNKSNQTYDGDFGLNNSGKQYIVKDAYAFNLTPSMASTYDIAFNVSGLGIAASDTYVKIFKTGFDFATNQSNTTNATELSITTSGDWATATTTSFSAFFIAEDHCYNSVQDEDETGTDCGGASCSACSVYVPTGGGGGGGGGSSRRDVADTYVITPSNTTQTLVVKKDDKINVVFNGESNYMHVKDVTANSILLWFDGTIYYHTLTLGESKIIGIRSLFANDIVVDLNAIEDGQATISIKLYSKPVRLFPFLSSTARETAEVPQAPTAPPAAAITPAPGTGQAPAGPTEETPVILESPVDIWTIVLATAFVIVLLGGIAVFRRKHLALDKPPAAIRTGLEKESISETELPPTTTQSRPVLTIKPDGKQAETKPASQPVSQAAEQKPKLSETKMKELEKYIYHALSEGFREEPIRMVLEKKGWPDEAVDSVFRKVEHVEKHFAIEGLHRVDPNAIIAARKAVRTLMDKKISKEQIKQAFARKGWSKEQIETIFEKI